MQHKCIKLTNPIWTFLLSPPARGRELKYVSSLPHTPTSRRVAPRAGAGIEIKGMLCERCLAKSPPARGRELKYYLLSLSYRESVAPRAGAGIEIDSI